MEKEKYGYRDFILKTGDSKSLDEINKLRGDGWKIVSTAPYRMVPDPESGSTVVREYFIILARQQRRQGPKDH